MNLNVRVPLTSNGRPIETSPDKFGELKSSSPLLSDELALRERMAEDGYLYLPSFFPVELVQQARASVIAKLETEDLLDPAYSSEKGMLLDPMAEMCFRPDFASKNPDIERLIYGRELMGFFTRFLGGDTRHFDFTWLRAISHGIGTCPHCDIVYMGRGTTNLYTAWTPLGNIPIDLGGLIILEGSNKLSELQQTYGRLDVDTECENNGGSNILKSKGYEESGAITLDPHQLRERYGGRWLTAEYNMGDVLIFGMFTVHGSLDNQTHRVRLSTDSRYQLSSEPIDKRWIGEEQSGHGKSSKLKLIC
ncbi:MAG TPA: phytanoyl-CoA dioxygenase family protein [Fimbriimonadaceae bacterium]|jgi:hypothetical protein